MKTTLRIALPLLFCIALLLCLTPACFADDNIIASGTCGAQGDNLTWELDSNGLLTISGTGEMRDYRYNSGSNNLPWYQYVNQMNRVMISEGVTRIGDHAFDHCTKLNKVTIPSDKTRVGFASFWFCSGLRSAGPVGSGCDYEFGWTESIPEYAFHGCNGLITVSIPTTVTIIDECAFDSCSSLKTVKIPSSVTSIEEGAFAYCENLMNLTIGRGVTNLGKNAFLACSSLSEVTIPSSVTSIGLGAFAACTGLTEVEIPSSVVIIGDRAFYNCESLTDLRIMEGVTSIGESAFFNCSCLTEVIIPSSVISIGSDAFLDCGSLNTIEVDDDNPVFCDLDGVLYNKDRTSVLRCPGGKSGTCEIPPSVTKVVRHAFHNCRDLTNVKIPESVTSIGQAAFSGCSTLKSITIPSSVTYMSDSAFRECSKLASVTIIEGVTKIGDYTFYGCTHLKAVSIPLSVTVIGDSAFSHIGKYDVYYAGNQTQWNSIKYYGGGSVYYDYPTIHYNSTGPEIIIESGSKKNHTFSFSPGESIEDIIPDSSFQYDPRFAAFLGIMATSAYNYDLMEQNYNTLGFDDTPPASDHFADNDPLAGYYIRRKTLADGSVLVLVTIRGSTDLSEWLGTNFNLGNGTMLYSHGWHSGFRASAEAAYGGISWLFNDSIPTKNVTYVLTGHSLGAAAANLLAIKLYEAGVPSTDIYDYNFACPNVAMGPDGISEWNPNGVHSNIFNIGNRFDFVSYLPGILCEKLSVANNFFLPANAKWNKYGVSYWFDNGFPFIKDAHMMEQYLDYLATEQELDKHHVFSEYEASAIFVNNNVNFAIYDNSDTPIFSFFDGSVNYYGHTVGEKAVALTDGERIIVYIREGIAYYIHYFPKNQEKQQFDMTFASTNLASGNISSERTFSAVNLAPDRSLVCSVGVDADVADIKLYVVDNNDNPISEVNEDGTERPIFTIHGSPYKKGSDASPVYASNSEQVVYDFDSFALSSSPEETSPQNLSTLDYHIISAFTTDLSGNMISSEHSVSLETSFLDTLPAGTYYLWGTTGTENTLIGSFIVEVADNVIATVNGVECTTVAEINAAVKDADDPVITVIPGRTIPVEESNSSKSDSGYVTVVPAPGYDWPGHESSSRLYISKDAVLDLNGGTVCGATVYASNLLIRDSSGGEGKATAPFILNNLIKVGGGSKLASLSVTGGSFVSDFNVSQYLAPGYAVESSDGWDRVVPVAYIISYDANGGNNAPETQEKMHGESLTLSEKTPYKSGWYFLGWAENPSAVDPDYPRPGGTFTRDANTVLYAVWAQPDLVLPSAVTEIGEEAFAGGTFRFAELPEHAVSIRSRAFADCPRLEYIYIYDKITDIAPDTFGNKEKLTIFGVDATQGVKSAAQVFAEEHGYRFVPISFRAQFFVIDH